jgi:cell division protein FtsW
MFFIAGAKLNQLLTLGAIGTVTFALVINYSSYAQGRVARYIAAIQNPLLSEEWQTANATQAMINGGPLGVGVGNSIAKLPGYLPLSWSDNIFAIIGEELGLIGTLIIILLFAILAYRGLRIALNAPDNFGMLLATGLTSLLTLQAVLNAAVVLAVAPPTGVTLPFISYGGSSLVMALGSIGILLNISRYSEAMARLRSAPGNVAYARFNLGWGNRRSRVPRAGGSRTTQSSRGKRTTSAQRSTRKASGSRSTGTGARRTAGRSAGRS